MGPRSNLLSKNNGKKSRDTVPLRKGSKDPYIGYLSFKYFVSWSCMYTLYSIQYAGNVKNEGIGKALSFYVLRQEVLKN